MMQQAFDYTAIEIIDAAFTSYNKYAVVPTAWIMSIVKPFQKSFVKYLIFQDNSEDAELVKQLCDLRATPPEDWQYFECRALGNKPDITSALGLIEEYKKNNMPTSMAKPSKGTKRASTANKNAKNDAKKLLLLNQMKELTTKAPDNVYDVKIFQTVDALPDNDPSLNLSNTSSLSKIDFDEETPNHNKEIHFQVTVSPHKQFDSTVTSEAFGSNSNDHLNSTNEDVSVKPKDTEKFEQAADKNTVAPSSVMNNILNELKSVNKKVSSLEKKVTGMQRSISDVTQSVEEVRTLVIDQNKLKENIDCISLKNLKTLHNLPIPVTSMNEFHSLNDKLSNQKEKLQEDLKTYLNSFINTSVVGMEKNVRPIIRSFISKTVACEMVPVKAVQNKIVFVDTILGQIIKECMVTKYSSLGISLEKLHKEFDQALGVVFNTKKQWKE